MSVHESHDWNRPSWVCNRCWCSLADSAAAEPCIPVDDARPCDTEAAQVVDYLAITRQLAGG